MYKKKEYAATEYQKRFYLEWLLSDDKSKYNNIFSFKIIGSLNVKQMQDAAVSVINHDYFLAKAKFYYKKSNLKFSISENTAYPIFNFEESVLGNQEKIIKTFFKSCCRFSFDLNNPPLVKFDLLRIDHNVYIFIVNFHHIILDSGSVKPFFDALKIRYHQKHNETCFVNNDVAQWQEFLSVKDNNHENINQEAANFWKEYLANKILTVPLTFKTKQNKYDSGLKQIFFEMDEALYQNSKKFVLEGKCTLYLLMMTIYGILLHRYSGSSSFFISYPVNTRSPVSKNLLGCFVNSIPIAFSFDENDTFTSILNKVVEDRKKTKKYWSYPIHQMIDIYRNNHSVPKEDLLNVSFSSTMLSENLLTIEGASCDGGQYGGRSFGDFLDMNTVVDIDLMIDVDTSPLRFCLQYNSNIFEYSVMKTFVECFQNLLRHLLESPFKKISEIDMLSPELRFDLLHRHGENYTLDEKTTIISLFEENVKKNPNVSAVEDKNNKITYQELSDQSDMLTQKIFSALELHSDAQSNFIAVFLDRNCELITVLLAILKTGHAYLSIDISTPEERIRKIVNNANPNLIITTADLKNKLLLLSSSLDEKIFCIEHVKNNKDNILCVPNKIVNSSSVAYVLYTSGTTGLPKGVPINHAGVCNLALWYRYYFNLRRNWRFSQFASVGFDAFCCEVWPALLNGSTVCFINDSLKLEPLKFIEWLKKNKIDICDIPSSLAQMLFEFNWSQKCTMQYLKVGGEKLMSLPKKRLPFNIVNSYGLTETCVENLFSNVYLKNEKAKNNFPIPIGKPIFNTKVYILDNCMNPVPVGVPGMLYVGGVGVSSGYLNSEEESRNSFIHNCFSEHEKNNKIFKTNDIGRWLPSGQIEYIGRNDNQIQLRGYRIELGEIESIILKNSLVCQAYVFQDSEMNESKILAYIVVTEKNNFNLLELIENIKRYLPHYMLPSAITVVDKIPLTLNGKINKSLLPKPSYITAEKIRKKFSLMEIKIYRLWKKIIPDLDLHSISQRDDFFYVGGSSLSIVQLMLAFNKKFNVNLTAIELIKNKTIESQSNLISNKITHEKNTSDNIILMRKNADYIPIVLIPSRGAGSESYSEFCQFFPNECSLYCLESYNLFCHDNFIESMPALAEHYASILEKYFPDEPYILGGWSFGGNVAYAIADLLAKKHGKNKKIPFLFMIDSLVLSAEEINHMKKLESLIDRIFQNKTQYLNLNKNMKRHINHVRKIDGKIFDEYVHPPSEENIVVFKANQYSFPPEATKNEMLLIESIYESMRKKLFNGWDDISKSVSVVNIDTVHLKMIQKPHAEKITELLLKKSKRNLYDF